MNVISALVWGTIATFTLTIVMSVSQGLGFSRISIPYLLGTALTGQRSRAMLYGIFLHMLFGLAIAFFYAAVFETLGAARWWSGILLGAFQGLVVLTVVLQILPYIHPRMASKHHGANPTRQLEPPGFLGMNYGRSTPLITLVAHLLFGLTLGTFYTTLMPVCCPCVP